MGQSTFSTRHTQWQYSTDFGISANINSGGSSYSRVNGNFGVRLRLSEHWSTHQDYAFQLYDKTWDTLFHSPNIGVETTAMMISLGYMDWDHPVLGYTYIGLGTGVGTTFIPRDLPLILFMKSRKGMTHRDYLTFMYLWNFNDFMNLYDDNIMVGVTYGMYWGRFSKYKRH